MFVEYNWIIFICLLFVLYVSNYYLEKIFKNRYKEVIELENTIEVMKNKKIKSIEEQFKYIDLKEELNNVFGSGISKFIFGLLMIIVFSIIIPYFPGYYKIFIVIVFSTIAPLLYIYKRSYRLYNYLSFFFIFIFFTGYMAIQSLYPLKFMNFNINILMMLPVLMLLNAIVKFIIKKVKKGFKRR